jgi:hypothetical protein
VASPRLDDPTTVFLAIYDAGERDAVKELHEIGRQGGADYRSERRATAALKPMKIQLKAR